MPRLLYTYSPIGRSCKLLSPTISVTICTTQHHWFSGGSEW